MGNPWFDGSFFSDNSPVMSLNVRIDSNVTLGLVLSKKLPNKILLFLEFNYKYGIISNIHVMEQYLLIFEVIICYNEID